MLRKIVLESRRAEAALDTLTLVRVLVFIAFSLAMVVGLTAGLPFTGLAEDSHAVFAGFRLLFAALLLLRLWRSRPALPMLWGYKRTPSLQLIWMLWAITAMCLLLGVGGILPVLINMLIFLLVFVRARYFSIEEIYFQLTSFFLLLMPVSAAFSLDAALGWDDFWWTTDRLSSGALTLWLNGYAWMLALLLLSAAMEKMLCSSWRTGLSFYYFIGLPHLLKRPFRFLRRYRLFCIVASYATVIGQGGLFISYCLPGVAPLFWLKHVLFGVLLFTIFDLSFIGQIFSLQFAFLLALHFAQPPMDITPAGLAATLLMMLFILLTAVRVLLPDVVSAWPRAKSVLLGAVKFSSGLVPIKVFNDAHLFGLYLYQIRDEHGRDCVPAFADDGAPAELQHWTPRYFQGAMYPVTDACLARRYHPVETFPQFKDFRVERIHDLFFVARQRVPEAKSFSLWVKAINPSPDYSPTTEHWLDAEWTEIYRAEFSGTSVSGRWLAEPPPVNRITRVLS